MNNWQSFWNGIMGISCCYSTQVQAQFKQKKKKEEENHELSIIACTGRIDLINSKKSMFLCIGI